MCIRDRGYVMERGALVDKMFYSIQLAFRKVPASLAVATLIVCTFWGIASGLVGAVVVLMGVIAMGPMLRAGYDVKLAAGVITAGGTLGILIPPSVMIIVYAAVAGQSVVKLYAAAMFPGFFLDLRGAGDRQPARLVVDVFRLQQLLLDDVDLVHVLEAVSYTHLTLPTIYSV